MSELAVLKMIETSLRNIGADGLCNDEYSCGCGVDDLSRYGAPCGEGPHLHCVAATREHLIDSRGIWEAGDDWYAPIDVEPAR